MWIVLKKELLELLRERRTLIFTFLMPTVIIPLLIGGIGLLAGRQSGQEAERALKYAVIGIEDAPGLDARLHATPKLVRATAPAPGQIEDSLKNQSLDFVLVVPTGFERELAAGHRMTLELHYNDAVKLDTTGRRVRALVALHSAALRERYLDSHQIDEAAQRFITQPIAVTVKSVANQRERVGEWVGAFLPYFFLLIGLSASIPAAMDMGAGEKERGTLESLLLLPLPRSRIVLGKFCAVALLGSVAGLVGVLSLAVWGLGLITGAGSAAETLLSGIGPGDVALVGLMILPANAIIASVLMAISFYGRSYREAVNYASALVFVLVGPILLALLPNMKLADGWAWMPITNIALAVKESVKGTLTATDFAIVFVSTSIIAGLLLAFCTAWCKRESVLFRN